MFYIHLTSKSLWILFIVAQSICTHYFSVEKLGRYADLKKTGSVCEPEINRKQNKSACIFFCYSKKEETAWLLLFLIANCKQKECGPDPEKNRVDATLYFLKVHLIFLISECRLTGRVWSASSRIPLFWWNRSQK